MRINRENYELFFVDYFDGNLSKELTQELFAFLDVHPDLKAEFEAFEPVKLNPENISYPDKATLKKSAATPVAGIFESNIEEWFIARLEGGLNEDEEKQLQHFLKQNPHLKKEATLYSKLKLHPDKAIVFENKDILKKRSALIPLPGPSLWFAAASVLLLFALYFFNRPQQDKRMLTPIDQVASYDAQLPSIQPSNNQPAERIPDKAVLLDSRAPFIERESQISFTMASYEAPKQLEVAFASPSPVRRMEMTTLFFYDALEEDLEYFEMLRQYADKNFFERVAYQASNRLFNRDELYITEPGLSGLNINRESLMAFNDFSISDLLFNDRQEKPRNKDYHFKSDMFEVVRRKGE